MSLSYGIRGRLFFSDARWAMEKHAALEEKQALIQRNRESARLVWSTLQVMFLLPSWADGFGGKVAIHV